MGLVLGARDEHDEVVRVPNGQVNRSTRLAFAMAELPEFCAGTHIWFAILAAGPSDVPAIQVLDRRQNYVGEEGGEDAALRGSPLGAPEGAVVEESRFQE